MSKSHSRKHPTNSQPSQPSQHYTDGPQQHPEVPQRQQQWSESQTLHVAACYSNHLQWSTCRRLAADFRRHMRSLPNVRLHFIELAHGDRPFDLTRPHLHQDDIQVRSNTVMFHKENLLNLAV